MMKLNGFLLSTLTLLSIVNAQQYFPVTGIQDGVDSRTGARPVRPNIDDLANDKYGWSLYIQALQAFQSDSQQDSLSYYEIAGIHGRPFSAWNGVYGPDGYSQATGYCTHDSILFPTWHRPYVALFEQLLHGYITGIAAEYTGSDAATWQAAAKIWRHPFWDWATSADMPSVVTQKTVTITTPTGQKTVKNPTYMYTFNPLNNTDLPLSDGVLARDKTTVRSSRANAVLENIGLQAATYNLFTHITDYSSFASQATSGNSLEAIHNYVHSGIGANTGNYHMAVVPYAAFDPIFWLHHFQVDRIFALWSAIYTGQQIPPEGLENEYGTFTIPPGTIDTSSSPLLPFFMDTSGTPWTSDQAYSMASLGYSYPQITDWNTSASDLSQSVMEYVQAQYGSSPGSNSNGGRAGGASKNLLKQNPKFHRLSNDELREWFCFVEVSKFALGQSFTVYIFIGSPPKDEQDWPVAKNLVGGLAILVSAGGAHAEMMMSAKGPTTHGEWTMGDILEASGADPSDVGAVVKYLKKNLLWTVLTHDGTIVDVDKVDGLLVSVTDEIITPADDGKSFPSFGPPTAHPEITRGKPGGAS